MLYARPRNIHLYKINAEDRDGPLNRTSSFKLPPFIRPRIFAKFVRIGGAYSRRQIFFQRARNRRGEQRGRKKRVPPPPRRGEFHARRENSTSFFSSLSSVELLFASACTFLVSARCVYRRLAFGLRYSRFANYHIAFARVDSREAYF